jgi:hypothetical protein
LAEKRESGTMAKVARQLQQDEPTYGSRGGTSVRRSVSIGQFGSQARLVSDPEARPEVLDRIAMLRENASLGRDSSTNITIESRPQRTRQDIELEMLTCTNITDLENLRSELSSLPEMILREVDARIEAGKRDESQRNADSAELEKRGLDIPSHLHGDIGTTVPGGVQMGIPRGEAFRESNVRESRE